MHDQAFGRLWLALFGVALLPLTLLVAATVIPSLQRHAGELERIEHGRVSAQAARLVEAMSEPLEAGAAGTLRDLLQVLVADPAVVVASVLRGETGAVYVRVGDSDHLLVEGLHRAAWPIPSSSAPGRPGLLEVLYRADRPWARELPLARLWLLAWGLGAALSGLLLWLSLRRRVARPLAQLTAALTDDLRPLTPAPRGAQVIGRLLAAYDRAATQVRETRDRGDDDIDALREDCSELHHLLAHLPGMIYRCATTPERRLHYVSEGARALTGRRLAAGAEGPAQNLTDLIHPEDRQRVWEAIKAASRQQAVYRIEYRLSHADGHECWVIEQGRESCDDGGRPYLEGFIADITERRALERQLRRAASVFDSTSEAVMIAELDGRLLAVNRAFSQITGYTEAEVLGKTPAFNKSGWHDAAFYRNMWAEIGRFGRWQGEIWNRRKNGEVYPAWLTISSVADDDARVVNYVAVFADISRLKRSQLRAEQLYYRDALTALPNQQLFASRVEQAVRRALRRADQFAVLVVDLDRFADCNDRLGYERGDQLLRAVGERLVATLRAEDMVARIGGDEFGVLVEHLEDPRDAMLVATKLLESFAREFDLEGQSHRLAASIGLAVYPEDGEQVPALLQNAESAAFRAKDLGRGRCQLFNPVLANRALDKFELQRELPEAIETGQLALHYQPLLDLRDGAAVAVEGLLRWQHPSRGALLPGEFLDLAGAGGRILALDQWALRAALEQWIGWQGTGPRRVHVNLAAASWRRPAFADSLAALLGQTGCPAAALCLEVREADVGQVGAGEFEALCRLQQLGVGLALDAVGGACLDLPRLTRIRWQFIKLARGWVARLPQEEAARAVLQSAQSLAASLGSALLAVGVENAAQRELLIQAGCRHAQGYLLGRPLAAAQLATAWAEPDGVVGG